jgi:hypothetical protein
MFDSMRITHDLMVISPSKLVSGTSIFLARACYRDDLNHLWEEVSLGSKRHNQMISHMILNGSKRHQAIVAAARDSYAEGLIGSYLCHASSA